MAARGDIESVSVKIEAKCVEPVTFACLRLAGLGEKSPRTRQFPAPVLIRPQQSASSRAITRMALLCEQRSAVHSALCNEEQLEWDSPVPDFQFVR
jgi:hypothetical protein